MADEWQRYVSDPRTICKYGVKCYQKNTDHSQKYKHPPRSNNNKRKRVNSDEDHTNSESEGNLNNMKQSKERDVISSSSSNVLDNTTLVLATKITLPESLTFYDKKDVDENLMKQLFLLAMPTDFYKFYECLRNEPCLEKTLTSVSLQLIGPYELLLGKLPEVDRELYLVHWRFFYDPPEFQAVMKRTGKSQYHIGYYRDDPKENPVFLGHNDSAKDCMITPLADNIFGAVYLYLQNEKKKSPFTSIACQKLMDKVMKWAQDNNYSVEEYTMKKRQSHIVTKTLHGAGIVVPYNKKTQLGYRKLAENDATIKKIFTRMELARSQTEKDNILSDLQPVITNANIAVDECDFGTGLEIGINLFCSGLKELESSALSSLCSAYNLLKREAFVKIIKVNGYLYSATIKKIFTRMELARSQTEKDNILSDLQPVITNANIAVDECDFGTGLEIGINLFCSGLKELESSALSSLCSAYNLLKREAFVKIIKVNGYLYSATIKKIFTRMELARSQTEKDNILSDLQPVITNANIAVDECDFGTGLEIGINLFCSGLKELESSALSSLCSAYNLLKREAFVKIIKVNGYLYSATIKKIFTRMELARSQTEKDNILSDLQPVITNANIAVDECDFGTGLEIGINLFCSGLKELESSALSSLCSAYNLLKREAFVKIIKVNGYLYSATIKKIFTRMELARSQTEKDNILSDLQPVITNANIAVDECDFGTGLEIGINLFCSGLKELESSALSSLCSAYNLLKREAFVKIIKVNGYLYSATIKKIFTRMELARSQTEKDNILSDLQPVITNANIAVDECDFGTGLEIGINLFCSGLKELESSALSSLCSAYNLLKREAFVKIIKAHIKYRRKGPDMSLLSQ